MSEKNEIPEENQNPNEKHLDHFIEQLREMNAALKKQIDINLKKDEEIGLLSDQVEKNDVEIDFRDKMIFNLNAEIEKKEREIARLKREQILTKQKYETKKEDNEKKKKKLEEELKKKQNKMSEELDETIKIIKKGEKINEKTLLLTKSIVQDEKV